MKLPGGITIGDKQIIIKRGSVAYGHLLDLYSNYFNSIILDKDIVAHIKKDMRKSKNMIPTISLINMLIVTRDFLIANGVAISDEKLKILSDIVNCLQAPCLKAFKTIENSNKRNRK